MSDSGIRLGFVSSYNAATGMASIYYPDRNHQVTSELPVYSPFGLLQKLNKDDPVYVLHLGSGAETGVILGGYSVDGDVPVAEISTDGSNLILKDSTNTTTLGNILARLAAIESRLTVVEGKV